MRNFEYEKQKERVTNYITTSLGMINYSLWINLAKGKSDISR